MSADGSSFSFGDLTDSFASLISGTASAVKDQIAEAASNKAVTFSQSIINGLSKAQQATSKVLGLSQPDQLAAKNNATNNQVTASVNKLFGSNLSTGQLATIFLLGGAVIFGVLWTFIRSSKA